MLIAIILPKKKKNKTNLREKFKVDAIKAFQAGSFFGTSSSTYIKVVAKIE